MMRRFRKLIFLFGTVAALSAGACGCSEVTVKGEDTEQESPGTEEGSEGTEKESKEPEEDSEEGKKGAGTGKEEPEGTKENPGEPGADADADAGQQESGGDGQERITGDIYELKDGSLVLDRYYEEETEDGMLLIASPANEVSEKNLETVYYDESTVFTHQTIYDGGARYDEVESSLEELKEGIEVKVYGQWKEDGFHAAKIQIIEVVL